MITYESRVKEIYAHPIGKDVIDRLLLAMGKGKGVVTNPVISNMKLRNLKKILSKGVGEDFFDTIITLLNSEPDVPSEKKSQETRAWWKEAVFYQIYPRSFKDSNGDGIGDIGGIIEKLDYLKNIGITCLWLSPIYDSPNDDNGYDIRDYQKIMQEFGTMEDFEKLLTNIHMRGMRLIMDLVINHTSDEHAWFKKAIEDPKSKEHEYYIFRSGEKETPPNNWTSFFSGPAWNYYEKNKEWGLHLFSKKQMDLNWENPELRKEVYTIVDWWLTKGVDGFRMDVGNLISKKEGLPDGNEMIGQMMGICGIEQYFYGPKLHTYLRELKEKAFGKRDRFLVGETPGIGMQMAKLLTQEDRKEMDMVFNFDQLDMPGHTRFEEYSYDLNYYKQYMIDWMEKYGEHYQMSLFYENHDNPRMLSKINKDPQYRDVLAKLLAVMQMTLKGSPFIYQGQEIGAVNANFASIDALSDVESINLYQQYLLKDSPEEAFKKILAGTRDHARVPMQWTKERFGGFSEHTPWLKGDEDYKKNNVEEQIYDVHSIVHFYKRLLEFRSDSTVIKYGGISFIAKHKKNVFAYYRTPADGEKTCKNKTTYFIECNISNHEIRRLVTKQPMEMLFSNYTQWKEKVMQPYEATIYKVTV